MPTAPTFARWLTRQASRAGPIGGLAAAAKADPRFPLDGGPREVSARLNELQADGDVHLALEDAEAEWCSLVEAG